MQKMKKIFINIAITRLAIAAAVIFSNLLMFDYLTLCFVVFIIAGTTLLCTLKKQQSLITNFASTLGVLGTFVGVFVALLDFNVADIQSSIPILLQGLKTAFITSIVGMVVSLLVRIFYKHDIKTDAAPLVVQDYKSAKALDDISVILREIRRNNNEFAEKQINAISAIIETQRNCTKDIEIKIEKFGQIVAEQSSKELISAIQKVMEDFNAKINDQLGQSFKELTESCKELNKWQQEHVGLLQSLQKAGMILKEYTQQTLVLMEKFNANCNLYNENAEEFKRDLVAIGEFIGRIQNVGDKFSDVMPLIEVRMNENTQRIAEIISIYESNSKKMLDNSAVMNDKMNKAMQIFSEHLTGVLKKFNDRISGIENNNTLFRR